MGSRPEIFRYVVTRPGTDINKYFQIIRTTDTGWARDVFMTMDDKYIDLLVKEENFDIEYLSDDRHAMWEEFVMDNYDGGRGEGVITWVICEEDGDDIAVVGGWPLAEKIMQELGGVEVG